MDTSLEFKYSLANNVFACKLILIQEGSPVGFKLSCTRKSLSCILCSLIHLTLSCFNYNKYVGYFSNLPKSIYFVRHNDISPKDPVMKGWKPFGIGGILGNSSVKGFTLRDKELLGVEVKTH